MHASVSEGGGGGGGGVVAGLTCGVHIQGGRVLGNPTEEFRPSYTRFSL